MTPEQQSIHLTGELARLRLEVSRLERELEQERQDRKQADLDTIRALGERNEARAEIAVWKHEAKRLEAELETFDQTAIEWWCEYQDLKAKARRDLSEIDRELDACVARSARDWRPLPGDPDEPSDANRLQTETDDQAGDPA